MEFIAEVSTLADLEEFLKAAKEVGVPMQATLKAKITFGGELKSLSTKVAMFPKPKKSSE